MDTIKTEIPQLDEPYASEVYKEFTRRGLRHSALIRLIPALAAVVWIVLFSKHDIVLPLILVAVYAVLSIPVRTIMTRQTAFSLWSFYTLALIDTLLLTAVLYLVTGNDHTQVSALPYMVLVVLALFSFTAEVAALVVVFSILAWTGLNWSGLSNNWLSVLLSDGLWFVLCGILAAASLAYGRRLISRQLIAEREYYTLLINEAENHKNEEPDQAEYIDRLTGLGTRAAFERDSSVFTNIFAEGRLNDLTIAFIDIENPTHLIEKHGHQEYKRMLQSFARSARVKFRSSDMVYRFSSDQFVLLAPGSTMTNADRLRSLLQQISEEVSADGYEGFKATMGISTLADVQQASEQIKSGG